MKLKPIVFLKSLNWNRDDVKKILMFIVMLSIGCFVLNNFLVINIEGDVSTDTSVDGRVTIYGSVDADVSGYIDADISGSIDADVSGEITADDPFGGFDVNIRQ